MSHSLSLRILILFCLSIASASAADFNAGEVTSRLAFYPRQGAVHVLPRGEAYDDSQNDGIRDLLQFSLLRIAARVQEMLATPGDSPLAQQLRQDGQAISVGLGQVFNDVMGGTFSVIPMRRAQHFATNRVYLRMTNMPGQRVPLRFFITDLSILELYPHDPQYWDGEILRALVSTYQPRPELGYRLRAAFWNGLPLPHSNPHVAAASAEYSLLTDQSFGSDYIKRIKILESETGNKIQQELVALMSQPPAQALAILQRQFIDEYRVHFDSFSETIAKDELNLEALEGLAGIHLGSEYLPPLQAIIASGRLPAWGDADRQALAKLVSTALQNADSLPELFNLEATRKVLSKNGQLPEALFRFDVDSRSEVAGEYRAFRERLLHPSAFSAQLFQHSSALADGLAPRLQDLFEFALHSILQNLPAGESTQPLRRSLKNIADMARAGLLRVELFTDKTARGRMLGHGSGQSQAEQNIRYLYIHPNFVNEYWESPIYWQGEILRNLALMAGANSEHAFFRRAVYWAHLPEQPKDPRIKASYLLYHTSQAAELGPNPQVLPDHWDVYQVAQWGFDVGRLSILIGQVHGVFASGDLAAIKSFLNQVYLDKMSVYLIEMLDRSLQGPSLLASLIEPALLMESVFVLEVFWSQYKSRFANLEQSPNFRRVERVLHEINEVKKRWEQQYADLVPRLEAGTLLPDRHFQVKEEPQLRAASLEAFASYLQSPERESCEGKANL